MSDNIVGFINNLSIRERRYALNNPSDLRLYVRPYITSSDDVDRESFISLEKERIHVNTSCFQGSDAERLMLQKVSKIESLMSCVVENPAKTISDSYFSSYEGEDAILRDEDDYLLFDIGNTLAEIFHRSESLPLIDFINNMCNSYYDLYKENKKLKALIDEKENGCEAN